MPFLTVASTPLRCVTDTWQLEEYETLGEEVRQADGSLGSTRRSAKIRASGDVVFLTSDALNTFRTAISATQDPGVPNPVTASSDSDGLLGGESITVMASLGTMRARRSVTSGVVSVTWRGPLTLRQV